MELNIKERQKIMNILYDKIQRASTKELKDALEYLENHSASHNSSSKKDCYNTSCGYHTQNNGCNQYNAKYCNSRKCSPS